MLRTRLSRAHPHTHAHRHRHGIGYAVRLYSGSQLGEIAVGLSPADGGVASQPYFSFTERPSDTLRTTQTRRRFAKGGSTNYFNLSLII